MTEVIAEIGINHNGSVETALELIDAAKWAGADWVKFQKRTPELCVPEQMRDVPRETPWGMMSYMAYRDRMEFGTAEFDLIDAHCKKRGIGWFVSVFDDASLQWSNLRDLPNVKIPSALLTDRWLVGMAMKTASHVILSTGMSTRNEVQQVADWITRYDMERSTLTVMHCHSAYPAPTEELNLNAMDWLRQQFPSARIGYSGHEWGIEPTVWAVAMGATIIERHITLDKQAWGSDHHASLEPMVFAKLVQRIRTVDKAKGDGQKRLWESERKARDRLRPHPTEAIA